MNLPSLVPAFIVSYDADRREARINIPGITDGDDYPIAEFNYPIGDNTENTEIRVLAGDRVWLMFENGDPRYPIIMGYRPKQVGNDTNWRRWFHANFEFTADDEIHFIGKRLIIDADTEVTVNTKTATINASESVSVTTDTASITATTSVDVMTAALNVTGESTFVGNVGITGNLGVVGAVAIDGESTMSGSLHTTGTITADEDIASGSVTLKTLRVTGVQSGNQISNIPVQ